MNKQKIADTCMIPGVYVIPGEHFKEKEFKFDMFCKHQGHLINQGITMCNIGLDPSKCDTCKFREPETINSKIATTSTIDTDHIFHENSHRQWYEEYHKCGAYWAKFWLSSGKKYAQTPKHIIRWILENHYKRKFK